MCVTLGVLTIFKHGQPALLYLVPGVLGALWGTALVRGELKEMWNYSEAGDDDEEEEGKKNGESQNEGDDRKSEVAPHSVGGKETKDPELNENSKASEHAHHVFLFSLSWPKRGLKNSRLRG
jgi:minor histocompatibility antigen H13